MKKIVAFLLLLSSYYGWAQPLKSDTGLPEPYDSAAASYYSSQSKAFAIYNGRVFYGYPGTIGHAFFPETGSEWQTGSVLYDGTWYYQVPLMYDVFKEEVLILQPNGIPVRLFSERVQKFNYQDKSFIRLNPDKDNVLKTGFYQQLTQGDATVLVRRNKIIDEKIEEFEVQRRFVPVDHYYLLKDGNYYVIQNKKTMFRLLKDKKLNMGRHLKKQQLKFKRDKEKAIVAMAIFYNQSNQ